MRRVAGWTGGLLVLVGSVLCPTGFAMAGMPALAAGAAVLSLAGPGLLRRRAIRIGLGAFAAGIASLMISNLVIIPVGSNELESAPYILSVAIGLLAAATGIVVTGIALLRVPGEPRLAGVLVLAGLLVQPRLIGFLVAAAAIAVLATRTQPTCGSAIGPAPAERPAEA
jgi:hypothetical protein